MDTEWLEAISGQQCADALVVEVARERAAGARRLVLIGQWAVLHNADSIEARHDAGGRLLPGTEQARSYGGDGTPEVAEFAVHELAVLQGLPAMVAGNELGDVLDLIHRHPRLWARLLQTAHCADPGRDPALAAGMVQAWQATWVARRCRNAKLSREAARWVDDHTADALGRQAWTTFQETVDAKIKKADPALAEQKRREKEASKRVTVSRTNDDGMKSLTVQLPAAQIIVMKARIHQIALILKALGAQDALAQLEADAAFLLATNPLEALLKLIDAAARQPATSTPDPEPEAGGPAEHQPDQPETDEPETDPAPAGEQAADEATAGPETEMAAADQAHADEAPERPAADQPAGPAPGPDPGPGRRLRPVPDLSPDPDPRQDLDFDDPLALFDDRPVTGREASQPADNPPAPDPDPPDPPDPAEPAEPAEPAADADPVPESAIHPSQHDDTCPTCGHDPTASRRESSALTRAALPDLDPAKLRPTAILYLHSSEAEFRCGTGTMRFENDGTAFTQREAVDILGHCNVKITRVIDLNDHHPVDCHEIPDRLAEQVRLCYPAEVFPFSGVSSRSATVDADHTKPYVPRSAGGPPGQTSLDNLAPLHRGSHRVKTHARGWTITNPRFGMHLWRTPHGYCFQRDTTGTTPLGKMTHEQFRLYTQELAEHLAWDDPDADDTNSPATG